MKKRILSLLLAAAMIFCLLPTTVLAGGDTAAVAKVGDTEYTTIDDALANWTAGKTLTLLANVTLSQPIVLKSTEHHTLNLGRFSMTAAPGQHAIVIKAFGTGGAERSAITINADAENPGSINADNKSCIYYNYADGGISAEDRPIIKINGGIFNGSTASFGTTGIYFKGGNAARKAATLNIAGGIFNCSINGQGKSKLIISGGLFHYSVGSQGDSTANRLISGGTFKSFGFMTADSNNTKFWIGTSMANSNVGVYVNADGYLVVGGPVITAPDDRFEASSTNYSGWNNYLSYSSASTYGLYYETVEEALADNTKNTSVVTIYKDDVNLTNSSYKGTINLPAGEEQIRISFPANTTPNWKVQEATDGNLRVFTQEVTNSTATRMYDAITPKISNKDYGTLAAGVPTEPNTYVLVATPKPNHWFVGWTDAENNVVSTETSYAFTAYPTTTRSTTSERFANPTLTATFAPKVAPTTANFNFQAPAELIYDGTEKEATVTAKNEVVGMGNITVKYYNEKGDLLTGAPISAGTYTVKINVAEGERYLATPETLTDSAWAFEIKKGNQDAPAIGTEAETISKKNDGKIIDVNEQMEYRAESETAYTAITGSAVENLVPGTYFVRYAGTDDRNPSADTAVTIAAGRKLTFHLPQNPIGYSVTTDTQEYDWMAGNITVTFTLEEGYNKTEGFKFLINGEAVELTDGTHVVLNDLKSDCTITVEGVADATAPTASIEIKENKWTTLSNIIFDLFYNQPQEVAISATDAGSGINSVEYFLSTDALTEKEVQAITQWMPYTTLFKLMPNNNYVVYVKACDKAGNVTYISSTGMVFDDIAPALIGIENGKTYYGDLTVSKTEQYKSATLDGVTMKFAEGEFFRIPADNKEHSVVVTDNAGNSTTYVVSVMKNYTVTFKADGKEIATATVGHGKNATLPTIPEKEGYNESAPTWDHNGKNITANTVINAVYTKNEEGEVQLVLSESTLNKGTLLETSATMINKVTFTKEENKQIEQGCDVKLWLEIEDITEKISAKEKDIINELIDENTKVVHLNVSLFKQVGAKKAVSLSKLNEKTTIAFSLPESLVNTNTAVKRTYKIIHLHNNKAEVILPTFDAEKNTLTFETATFSTYTIAYTDTPVGNNPNTGDHDNVILWITLMVLSVAVLAWLNNKKKLMK